MGVVKLTIQKFYRINGGSTQRLGVIPDIKVTDMYKYIEYSEKEYEFALPYDSIPTAEYNVSGNGVKNMAKIHDKSSKRLNDNEAFRLIDENAKRVERVSNDTKYSLNFDTYEQHIDQLEEEANKYKDVFKEYPNIEVLTMDVDKTEFEKDDIQKEKIKKWHTALKKDPYLQEAINVLNDLN